MRTIPASSLRLHCTRWTIAATLLSTAACVDAGRLPTAPVEPTLRLEARIDCVGSTTERSLRCAQAEPGSLSQVEAGTGTRIAVPGPMRDVIIGNQGGYVRLTSSNITSANNIFGADVTVQNLLPQPIGTTDGVSAAAAGIRVFFINHVTALPGPGLVDFVNPSGGMLYDSVGTFTASGQEFYRYVEILSKGQTSASKRWQLRYDSDVVTFSFSVYVSAPVKFPSGYVSGNPNVLTLNPGETYGPIVGSVRNFVNTVVPGAITFASLDGSVASVSAGGVVTATASGNAITYITLQSGSIPNYVSTAVNVCPTTPTIVSGVPISGVIDGNDCYSSFASIYGRPDPAYRSDMFRISLTAGQQIGVTMTSDNTFRPFLNLVDPIGVVERTAPGNGGFGSTATIPTTTVVQRTGVYVIEAGQDVYTPGGTYTVTATVLP